MKQVRRIPIALVATILLLGLSVPGTLAEAKSVDALADSLIERSEIWKGVCVVLGAERVDLASSLAATGDHFVHVIDPDRAAVETAQEAADKNGLYGKSIVVEPSSLSTLPYAEHMIDLVLAADLTAEALGDVSLAEVLRSLRPLGWAILGAEGGTGLSADDLKKWLAEAEVEGNVVEDDFGVWAQIQKPKLDGVDEWTHWEHGPDNNPVSTDKVIQAPYMTQFLAKPYYIAMPAITTSAGGRTFIAMGHIAHHQREEPWLNTLLARNGYNGTELWRRKLPDGYLVHRSAFIATEDVFYMIDPSGAGVLKLDPNTGDEIGRIRPTRHRGDWKWIAMKDGVLYALVGKDKDPAETTIVRSDRSHWSWGELSKGYYQERVPWGFGHKILAIDMKADEVKWVHEEEKKIDSRAMVMGGGKIFIYGPDSYVARLDEKTGNVDWKNSDADLIAKIEEPGVGLSSTPGFRTNSLSIYTPNAIVYQGQTRMNVVAISTEDGRFLWTKPKTTNNPNLMYLEDKLLVGVGKDGSTLILTPEDGEFCEDLQFMKRSCARLTATPDSLFVRGMPDGLTRYDRINEEVLFNGAFRPACNDGVIGANGMLYAGPWLCDCNLTLMGRVAMCSAGDFQFQVPVKEEERLETGEGDIAEVAPFEAKDNDWSTYRASNSRAGFVDAEVASTVSRLWRYNPGAEVLPTSPVVAGGLVFVGGDDGKARAIDASSGQEEWVYRTGGPITQSPSVWEGRVYVGSGDGFVYCLEAATGRMLWRFRCSPVERRIMLYGSMTSTWPVNSGVLVEDGVAYACAGVIDYDGTYVYALDAKTGKVKWYNDTSGHLDPKTRKGASGQGNLSIADGKLWMAAGNVVTPAAYDLETGHYVGKDSGDGSPQANRGEEIGVIDGKYVVQGGRLRFSATKNVVNPGWFEAYSLEADDALRKPRPMNTGKIPPVWDDTTLVHVNGPGSPPSKWEMDQVRTYLDSGDVKEQPRPTWIASALQGNRDTVSLALTQKALLAVSEDSRPGSIATQWNLNCVNREDGNLLWEIGVPDAALPGGIAVDSEGRMILSLEDGSLVAYGGDENMKNYVRVLKERALSGEGDTEQAVAFLAGSLADIHSPEPRQTITDALAQVGVVVGRESKEEGFLVDWNLLAPMSWDPYADVEDTLIGEPKVDLFKTYTRDGRVMSWRPYTTELPKGEVDLARIYNRASNKVAFAYTEIELDEDQDLILKTGSNDGMVLWLNEEEVGRFDGPRGYSPDADTWAVKGKKGTNRVLMKIMNLGNNWGFCVRVADENEVPIRMVDAD